MNWIKQNTFLAGLLAVLIVGAVALGYFFMKARGQYADAKDRLSAVFAEKARLEGQRPYPSDDNANALRKLVSDYRASADAFTNKMLNAQAVMPSGVRVARFQEDLALKVDAVIGAAEATGVILPEGFYLGMDKYRAQVPLDGAVDRLQYQLDATVRLSDLLFANDVTRFGIRRQTMPFETREGRADEPRRGGRDRRGAGGKPSDASETVEVTETYPMEVVLEITERGFQNVLNALSNTGAALAEEAAPVSGEEAGEYYFVTRWMRVENQVSAGPERSDPDDADNEIVDSEVEGEEDPAAKQLNMVFGAEKIRAYLALDLVRFLKPTATVAN